jgi:hypothetical protein
MKDDFEQEAMIDMPSGTRVRQLSVFLQNEPGALLALVRLLRDHRISVLGLSLQDTTELNLVRLVLTDPDSAQTLFIEKGIPHASLDVTVVELEESGRDLDQCLLALLAEGINVRFMYPLLARPGLHPLVAIQGHDTERASEALLRAGFKVLVQEDLSR